jgi:hypothetical protein
MKFWKLGLALSLTAAFGITACDDSSSADEKKIGIDDATYEAGKVACVVTSTVAETGTFVQEMRMDDLRITMTVTLDDSVITEKIEHNQEIPQDTCEHYKLDPLYETVECKAKTITAVNKGTFEKSEFEALTELLSAACKESNGQDIPKKEEIEENLPKLGECSENNKGEEAEVFEGKGVFVVCDGKNWVPSKNECKGDAKVDIATITLACKDGKWTLSSDKECEDGKPEIKKFSGVELSVTCTDGAWVIDVPEAKTEDAGEPATEETTEEEGATAEE